MHDGAPIEVESLPLGEFNVHTDKPSIALRLIGATLSTAINVVLLASRLLLGEDKSREIRWAIVRELLLILWVFLKPVAVGLQSYLSGKRWVLWSYWGDAFLASLSAWTRFIISVISMILMLTIFPQSEDGNYLHQPWSFFTCYSLIIFTIYSGLACLGSMIVNAATFFYENELIKTKVRDRTTNALVLALSIKFTTLAPDNSKKFFSWKKALIKWSSTRSYILKRKKLVTLHLNLDFVDLEGLSLGLWGGYEEAKRDDHSLRWIDFIAPIVTTSRFKISSDYILFDDSRILDRDGLEEALVQIKNGIRDTSETIICNNKLFSQLNACFTIVWIILIVVVILPMLGFTPNYWLLPMGVSVTPSLIALTVIFGVVVTNTIEAIIFTFYRHPFDVRDEIKIEGVMYTIKRIGILYSVLENWMTIQVYFPTILLMQKPIVNLSRSSIMRQQAIITFPNHLQDSTIADLSGEVLQALRRKLPATYCSRRSRTNTGLNRLSELCFLVDHPNTLLSSDDAALLNAKQIVMDTILETLQTKVPTLQISNEVFPIFVDTAVT